jgi:hypothetical protein
VATTHAAGALFSINHPVGDCGGCAWEQTMPEAVDGIEIWNGRVGPQAGAMAIWDRLLKAGRRVTGVGASDWHHGPDPIDAAAVRVFAPTMTERALLDAIRAGHVVVMRSASDMPPDVVGQCGNARAIPGDALMCAAGDGATINATLREPSAARVDLVWNGATIASQAAADSVTFALPNEPGYARVQVYARDGAALAITNPVYVQRR